MSAPDDIIITTDPATFDIDRIHRFLAASDWAKNISRALVVKSIENALCFGLFRGREQIGFARLITDRATFAYLADVFILAPYRGRGLGRRFIRHILNHEEVSGLRRVLLATQDAHEFYRSLGFTDLANPRDFMTIHRPSAHQRPST